MPVQKRGTGGLTQLPSPDSCATAWCGILVRLVERQSSGHVRQSATNGSSSVTTVCSVKGPKVDACDHAATHSTGPTDSRLLQWRRSAIRHNHRVQRDVTAIVETSTVRSGVQNLITADDQITTDCKHADLRIGLLRLTNDGDVRPVRAVCCLDRIAADRAFANAAFTCIQPDFRQDGARPRRVRPR